MNTLIVMAALILNSWAQDRRVIETPDGEVTLSLEDKRYPEPAKHPKWLIVEVQCQNGNTAEPQRLSTCDSNLRVSYRDGVLLVEHFDWEPIASSRNIEGKVICNKSRPLKARLSLARMCR